MATETMFTTRETFELHSMDIDSPTPIDRLQWHEPPERRHDHCETGDAWTTCLCEVMPAMASTMATCDHYGRPVYDARGHTRAHVVEIGPDNDRYAAIELDFADTPFEVTCVARVQNPRLAEMYAKQKEYMSDDLITVNERYNMYHTPPWHCLDTIYVDGLDQRRAARGMYGRGIYMSDDPAKCDKYWRGSEVQNMRFMLRCRALLGNVKVYQDGMPDRSLMVEPPGYDSVQGRITNHTEHVVYNNTHVLVEYVVGYTMRQPVQ